MTCFVIEKRYICRTKNITMSKLLLTRYIWLVDNVYQAGSEGITFNELSEKWKDNLRLSKGEEYNWRTFMRHKNDVLELFGVEIGCHKSTNAYYIVERGDLADSSGFRRWLIETLSVSNRLNESAQLKDRILLEPNPSGGEFLATLLEAMRDGNTVTFDYQPFWMGGNVSSLYNVEPYALKVFKRRWYLLGKYGNSPLKIYALDRMKNIDIEFNKFELPENFSAEAFFSTCFGIFVGEEEPQIIKIKVKKDQAKYLRTLPLHTSQKEEETTDNYAIFSYFLRPTFDFIQELLTMGERMEVLEPKSLRKEMARIGKEIANKHKGNSKTE